MAIVTERPEVESPPDRLPNISLVDPYDRLHRITLDSYRGMGEHGQIKKADRVVLLDGLLVKKMTKGSRHTTANMLVWQAIAAVLPTGWYARKEDPIELPDGPTGADSAPEPDVSVVSGVVVDYRTRHPGPGEVALIVEVADSSLAADREMLRRYAWAGIPCVWIVNLPGQVVEVYTQPTGRKPDPRYAALETKGLNDTLAVMLAGRPPCGPIAVKDFLA